MTTPVNSKNKSDSYQESPHFGDRFCKEWFGYGFHRTLAKIVIHTAADTAAYVSEEVCVDDKKPSPVDIALKIGWYGVKSIVKLGFFKNSSDETGVFKQVTKEFCAGAVLGSGIRVCTKSPHIFEKIVRTGAISGGFDIVAYCVDEGGAYIFSSSNKIPDKKAT